MIRSLRLSLALACTAVVLLTGCGGGGGGSASAPPVPTPSLQAPPSGPAVVISTASLKPAASGQPYLQPMTATGGSGKYTWRVQGLPDGVNIDPNSGVIAGTPTQYGQGVVVVSATDSVDARNNTSHAYIMFISQGFSLGSGFNTAHVNAGYISPLPVFGAIASVNVTAGALPPGLQVTTDVNGIFQVTGTPTQTGTFPFTLQITSSDPSAEVLTQAFSITVDSAFAIAQARADDGILAKPYSFTFSAVNGTPPYTWSLSPVPPNMTFDPATGTLSGNPVFSALSLQLSVSDASTPARSVTQNIEIDFASPLTLTPTVALNVNRPVFRTSFADGGKFPLKASVFSGALPPGLSFDFAGGTISGETSQIGAHRVLLQISDSSQPPQTVQRTVDFHVTAATMFAPNPGTSSVSLGAPMLASLPVQGGTSPFHWQITQGQLPAGLSFDTSKGAISGIPTVTGMYTFSYKVTDSSSPVQTATNFGAVTVNSAVHRNDSIATATPITSGYLASLSPYEDGVGSDHDYYKFLAQPAGIVTVTLSPFSAGLPPSFEVVDAGGVRLNACRTSGSTQALNSPCVATNGAGQPLQLSLDVQMPTQANAVTAYIHVFDWKGMARPDSLYTISVLGVINVPLYTSQRNFVFVKGQAPNLTVLQGTGGVVAPLTWSLVGGALPSGMSVASTGNVTGAPTTAGVSDFTLRLSDASTPPLTQDVNFTFRVVDPVQVATTTLPPATAGTAYSFPLLATGGTGGVSWQVQSADLPSVRVDPTTGILSVANPASGTYHMTVTAFDPFLFQSGSKDLTLSVP